MHRIVASSAMLLLAGCAADTPPGLVVRSDSAGVELVTNRVAPADLPLRSLPAEAVLQFGAVAGSDVILLDVRALALLGNGNLAVASNGTNQVFVFDAGSNVVTAFGREGDGPGEFDAIESLVAHGDSLVVYDPSLHRMTVYSEDGALGRTLDLSDVVSRGWSKLLALDDGFVVFGEGGMIGPPGPGTYRSPVSSRRIDRDGRAIALYGEFPGVEMVVTEALMGRLPFGARTFGTSYHDIFVVGSGEASEIAFYDESGALDRIVRWPDHTRRVSPERNDAFIAFQLQRVPEDQRAQFRARLAGVPYADVAPPYEGLIATEDGEVWVGDYPGPEALRPEGPKPARMWTVVAQDGVIRERVGTPAGFEPHLVTKDRVFGVYTDDLGVESIRAYELGRQADDPRP